MWRRGKLLGRGGFGFVSLAKPLQNSAGLPPLMAVKSAEISKSATLQLERDILQEFVDCPRIIRCFGSDCTQEMGVTLFNLFLELAKKGCLRDRLRSLQKRAELMLEAEVKKITKSILIGLCYIHGKGYVHCDIKPDNILFTEEDEVKIADFGWAKKMGKEQEKGSDIRGTKMYMAPEGLDREYGPVFDVWSLGCTVLEMLTGKVPWEGADKLNSWNLVMRISYSNEIPQVPDWLSEEAADFLNKCFYKDSKQRWTADRLLEHKFITDQ